jgi:hypothetical protein
MTLLTPKSNEILLKMENGMPLPGMNPLNVEDIVNAEVAKVYDALICYQDKHRSIYINRFAYH